MIDVKPLRYFVTLAETRHFGRAAAALHLSQPPLSRQIAALEATLGVTLFDRAPRNVSLTAAGERFYQDAIAILASIEQAGKNVRAAARGDLGALSIGFTMCASYSVMPRFARAFGAAHPDVSLSLREVVSNDLAAQVVSGQIDAAIMFQQVLPDGLAARIVVDEPLCVALAQSHPLANDAGGGEHALPLHIAQLAGEPFVLAATEVAPRLRDTIVTHCRAGGFEPTVRFEVQLQQTVLSLVDENVGVALVPDSMRKAALPGVRFRTLADAPTIEQILVWSPTNRNPCLAPFLALDGMPRAATARGERLRAGRLALE